MQLTSPARNALGLVAAGAIGIGTAVLGEFGVAQAETLPVWSTSEFGPQDPVPADICAIAWQLKGAGAGADSEGNPGSNAGLVVVTLPAVAGQVYTLFPGGAGTDADGLTPGVGGTNADMTAPLRGANGRTDGVRAGGGGGGASSVGLKRVTVLQAFGATAGGALGGSGGGGGQNLAVGALESFDASATTSVGPRTAGSVTGTGLPCPEAPVLQSAVGGDSRLTLAIGETSGRVPVASYQYTLDDGVTWKPLVGLVGENRTRSATIAGLTNGTPYTVRVRALPAAGVPSAPSDARTATPVATPVAPPVATPVATPVAPPVAPSVAPADPVAPPAAQPSSSNPVLPTVPTSHGQLSTDAGTGASVVPGGQVTVSGKGYAPHSTITVLVYSEPRVLTTVVSDEFGAFTTAVTVPDDLRSGRHTLVASGFDALGNVRTMTLPVTVSDGTTGDGELASTGADIALPAIGGWAAVALGGALLLIGRRRTTSS